MKTASFFESYMNLVIILVIIAVIGTIINESCSEKKPRENYLKEIKKLNSQKFKELRIVTFHMDKSNRDYMCKFNIKNPKAIKQFRKTLLKNTIDFQVAHSRFLRDSYITIRTEKGYFTFCLKSHMVATGDCNFVHLGIFKNPNFDIFSKVQEIQKKKDIIRISANRISNINNELHMNSGLNLSSFVLQNNEMLGFIEEYIEKPEKTHKCTR